MTMQPTKRNPDTAISFTVNQLVFLTGGLVLSLMALGCSTQKYLSANPNLATAYSSACENNIANHAFDTAIANCTKAIGLNPMTLALTPTVQSPALRRGISKVPSTITPKQWR